MVTYRGEQVIVTGVDSGGRNALVHPVKALGDCMWVEVGDL